MLKDRFGVINPDERDKYEKEFQIPMGYYFTTFYEKEAISVCRKNPNTVVERIYNDFDHENKKEQIYRGPMQG